MRMVALMFLVGVAGCAADGGGGGTTVATAFDGTYRGTVETVSGCGAPRTDALAAASITGGRLSIPLQRGTQRLTGLVRPNGDITQIVYSDTRFSSNGRGRVDGNRFVIDLETASTTFAATCSFRYVGERTG